MRNDMDPLDEHVPRALYLALRDDPFYQRLEAAHSDHEGAQAAMLRYFALSIREAETWGRVEMVSNGSDGAAVWTLPMSPEAQRRKRLEKTAALIEAMGAECAAMFNRIEENMAVHEHALGLDGHWYLSILGVAPEAQGQGVGARLLAPTLSEADAAGAHSYLTTFSPRNIRFYERIGYVVAGKFDEPVTGADFHVLVRASQGHPSK